MPLLRMVILDVNAPRSEIEETEDCDEQENEDADENLQIFQMDDCNIDDNVIEPQTQSAGMMAHPIAQTLDICMEKLYSFLDLKKSSSSELQTKSAQEVLQAQSDDYKFLKLLLATFENVILPCHNTHHVQFLIFYYCSFKASYLAEYLDAR